ncbi:uncharacterized protein JCM15063_000244 [Sporobolomyces koalae]|uniref:uncharacterized protein n=1 Tax=Sporobolomyces koalae TaxID=500713 RepID=UPI00316C7728
MTTTIKTARDRPPVENTKPDPKRGDNATTSPFKLTLLGPSSSGKTALRKRFVMPDKAFGVTYVATIGCDFLSKSVNVLANGNEQHEVELQLWDTAGQERFASISAPFFRRSRGLILTFDYSRPVDESIANLRAWFDQFRTQCDRIRDVELSHASRSFCWAVVGCKVDLVEDAQQRKAIEREIANEVKHWFTPPNHADVESRVTGKDFNKSTTVLEIGPSRRIAQPGSTTAPTTPRNLSTGADLATSSTSTVKPFDRPPLSSKSTSASSSSTLASIELSSSIPTPQALNPTSLLLMSTSPPHPPRSIEPLGGHPRAIYEGGPFSVGIGRLLDEEANREPDDKEIETGEPRVEDSVENCGKGEQEPEATPLYDFETEFGFRLFRTSAKTGQGVDQVFEYCAARIVHNLKSRPSDSSEEQNDKSVIKINEVETLTTRQKFKRACCF